MRILYVRNLNHVAELVGGDLAQRGHAVRVYEPNLAGNEASLPIKLLMMPRRVLSLQNVVGDLDRSCFDIVHIHWASYGALGLLSRIPFIVECHGSDVRYHLKQPFYRPVLASILRRAAAVLCITPDLVPIVQSVRPDAFFLPGPVDTERFSPPADCQETQSRPWTILLFTRLDPIKGPEIALDGIARFASRHPQIRVQLLDWGLLKDEYKARHGNRFEFIPPVPTKQVQQLLWSADAVVGQCKLGILSFCELQAMSCAKPVICSFHYKNAYPTPPPICCAATAEQVDENLENIFQHPEVGATLGQSAREWVIKNHELRTISLRLENIYRSFVEVSS